MYVLLRDQMVTGQVILELFRTANSLLAILAASLVERRFSEHVLI